MNDGKALFSDRLLIRRAALMSRDNLDDCRMTEDPSVEKMCADGALLAARHLRKNFSPDHRGCGLLNGGPAEAQLTN